MILAVGDIVLVKRSAKAGFSGRAFFTGKVSVDDNNNVTHVWVKPVNSRYSVGIEPKHIDPRYKYK